MQWWGCLSIALASYLYCEFLADYIALLNCSWPTLITNDEQLRSMIIADPHLLGPFRGHWLDKLYREWHMHRAFQSALTLFQPEVIFVLGDLFDEGEFVDDIEFQRYVDRFNNIFAVPEGTIIVSAVGNHDVGFHYKLHPHFTNRFKRFFNNTGVHMYTLKEVHFVVLNSMAMQNDECDFCEKAKKELNRISYSLNCLKSIETCELEAAINEHKTYSRPILMQHFPTYRVSDIVCLESDMPKIEKFRENWEVLSKKSTDLLGALLNPRLAFAGHSHHYCHSVNRWGIKEYTVASFSWRNKINPSFLLASFTSSNHIVYKCNMLQQQTVYNIYFVAALAIISLLSWQMYETLRKTLKEKSCRNIAKIK